MKSQTNQGGHLVPPPPPSSPAIPLALNLLAAMIERIILERENEQLKAQIAALREKGADDSIAEKAASAE